MRTRPGTKLTRRLALAALAIAALDGCDEGPAILARPQTITFATAPSPPANQASATVSATASSGLPVSYRSTTPSVCLVDSDSGLVTATTSGSCTIAANQSGNSTYAPAPQVTQDIVFAFFEVLTFSPAPALSLYDLGTVTAVDSYGRPVSYASSTPSACSVDSLTGLVTTLSTGDCTVVASAGTLQATQTLSVSAPPIPTPPGAPSGVSATAGDAADVADVRIGGISAGGSPITGYSVSSTPPGISAAGAAPAITVTCPSSCTGYAFSVTATNGIGTGPPSPAVDIVTSYDVVATFHEPDTQPNDSIFVGSFTLDSTNGAVSNLRGRLSEAMTGGPTPYPDDTMTWLTLDHQLSIVPVTLGGASGFLVTTFLLDTTDTLSMDPVYGGTDGWSPGTGRGLYYGYPGTNPGNAYVRIFVNSADPLAALVQAQIDKLAYADCTPGGMMGASCMTGTTVPGYGTAGTMSGYPVSQATTRQ
ncbi:MAG TPA: hypothetical protein VMK42_19485 [Anaeromyxobacteraceae bacterium]|nr:hypothetical protein [Anaeromyxobacteraceae bacterium]